MSTTYVTGKGKGGEGEVEPKKNKKKRSELRVISYYLARQRTYCEW